jgi:DNA gyrase subunit A
VQELRAASRTSGGVRGIRLETYDQAVSFCSVPEDTNTEMLVVTENGYGKRTPLNEYPVQGRGGGGVITARLTDKTGSLAAARILTEEDRDLMIISAEGTVIRTDWRTVAQTSRPTQGVRLMNLGNGDRVVAAATIFGDDDEAFQDALFAAGEDEDEEPSGK